MNAIKSNIIFCLLGAIIVSCNPEIDLNIVELSDEGIEMENGVLQYQSIPFNGIMVSYHPDFTLKSRVQYFDGRKQGIEHYWFENGKPAMERHYSKGVKTGIHRAWWIEGNLKFEYHFNEDGAYNGSVKEWYASNQLFREFNYENGKEVGSQRLWKSNGNIKANYIVSNGDRFGLIGLKKCATVSDTPKKNTTL